MDVIRQLCERLKQEADKIGLHPHQIAVIPHSPDVDAPDMMQAIFIVKDDVVAEPVDEEQAEVDDAFASIVDGFNRDTEKEQREEQKNTAVEDIKGWLEGS